MTKLRAAALSDIGKVRRENEDCIILDEGLGLFAVADGVGGLPGGLKAAQRTVDEITAGFRAASEPPDITGIVRSANAAVILLGQKVSPMGIGTTLTVGRFHGGKLRIGHVGDSRCYGWRAGEFLRLTEDHSVENDARLRRARGEVVYYNEEHRNVLTRCIGQIDAPEVDLVERTVKPGDRYLFCTDGITRLVSDAELSAILGSSSDPAEAVQRVVSEALDRGGPDNATAVVIHVDEP